MCNTLPHYYWITIHIFELVFINLSFKMTTNLPPDPIYVLRGSNAAISCIKFFHPDDESNISKLAVGNQDGQLILWDLKIRGIEKEWKAHSSSVLWIHPISETLIWTEGRNESVILWELENTLPVKLLEFPLHEYLGFSPCSLSKHNNTLAIPGPTSTEVSVMDVKQKTVIHRLLPDDKERGMVMSIKWVNGGSIDENLIVAYEGGHISLWNIKCVFIISEIKVDDTPICFSFCQSLNIGMCGTSSNELVVLHVSKEGLSIGNKIGIKNEGVSSCCFRTDGKIYATGGWDHRIRIFSGKKQKALAVLKYHKGTIECVEFSKYPLYSFPSGLVLACGSADHSVSLWNLYNS